MERILTVNGNLFLSKCHNYGLLLNVDWLQPYKHLQYKVGVMYLAILNLPRSIRYKRENVILVGIIPGPIEPHLTINSYLSLLVSDLDFWMELNSSFVMEVQQFLSVPCSEWHATYQQPVKHVDF